MNTTERRKEILHILRQTDSPIAAKELAARFHVSRQVIVQDLAVIRASHTGIVSTYRGYILQQESGCMREFKVRHGLEQTADELNIIVDCGGRVKSISISHRVYGRVSAEMDIQSRRDVVEFLQRFEDSSSTVLSTVTDGYHYHLVEAATAERLDLIERELREQGFLAPLAGASRMPPRGGGTGRLCGLYHRHYGSGTKKRCQRVYHRHRKQHCGASVVCLPGKAFLPADRTADLHGHEADHAAGYLPLPAGRGRRGDRSA